MHTTQACTQLMLYVFSSRLNSKNNPITMNNKMSKPRDLKKNNPKAENCTEGKKKKGERNNAPVSLSTFFEIRINCLLLISSHLCEFGRSEKECKNHRRKP